VKRWPPVVVFTGMGSSLYASYPAQAYLSERGIRSLVWETAELLHHHLKFLGPDTLLVVVSQSGETVEVKRLLEALPRNQAVLGVVNVEASTLARKSSLMLPMMSGRQDRVSTKTYMCSVAVLMYLAFAIAREDPRAVSHALLRAIESMEGVIEHSAEIVPPTVEFFNHPTYTALMSRGPDLSSAYQGALMLKEVARLAAEATSAAQFRHGPIEIVNTAHRYIVIARKNTLLTGRRSLITGKFLLGIAEEIRSHGGRVLLLTDLPAEEASNTRLLQMESAGLGMGTLVDTLHIQLVANELALRAGLVPGKLWIAEGVTRVE
ncbi:MAG: SIS domain-containing protein, partial [Acidobacteriota bacterium]|nr:SIS domain-containing protein [Acidobacteriota bacterium]